jgi:2'-5' RNA ligase
MRAFLAIPIDPRTTQQLSALVAQLKQTDWGERVIWFPPENYHLTLHFLGGKVKAERVRAVADSMQNWFAEGMSYFEAEVRKIEPFPSALRAHTLIAKVQNTIMLQYLVREIKEQVKPLGFTAAQQAFRPHISLGRIPLDLNPVSVPSAFKNLDNIWLNVDRITLYQSELTDGSPIYTPLAQCSLETYG